MKGGHKVLPGSCSAQLNAVEALLGGGAEHFDGPSMGHWGTTAWGLWLPDCPSPRGRGGPRGPLAKTTHPGGSDWLVGLCLREPTPREAACSNPDTSPLPPSRLPKVLEPGFLQLGGKCWRQRRGNFFYFGPPEGEIFLPSVSVLKAFRILWRIQKWVKKAKNI